MSKELDRSTVLRVDVPGNKFVTLVRFFSDHPDPEPVEAYRPWYHPWWVTGTYLKGGSSGCVILAYVDSNAVVELKKAWPEGRDFVEISPSARTYLYTVNRQPPDDYLKENFPRVWGEWAHCGMIHRWSLIIREKDENDKDSGKPYGARVGEEVIVDHEVIQPKAEDFLIWWLSPDEVMELSYEEDSGKLNGWPRYLRSEIRSMAGRNPKGQLWIHPTHMDISPIIAEPDRTRIDEDKGGIVFLRRDFDLLSGRPGRVTDFKMKEIDVGAVAVNDFRIWWTEGNYIGNLVRRQGGLDEMPDYLAENIYELTADMEKGVDNNGVLLVHDDHDKYLNVTDERRRHFNPTRVGIAFLVNDICCVRKHPGIITTMDGVVLETREFLPMGGMVSKF